MITCNFEDGGKATLRHGVVHALAVKDGKILLVRRSVSSHLEGGKLALPGGFIDRDETAAQAVLRELREETGWSGKVITCLRVNTNPNRAGEDRQNIAFDFLIEPLKQIGTFDHEVSEIVWAPIADIGKSVALAFDHDTSIVVYRRYIQGSVMTPIIE